MPSLDVRRLQICLEQALALEFTTNQDSGRSGVPESAPKIIKKDNLGGREVSGKSCFKLRKTCNLQGS
jgi:hypothetical protein